MAVISGSIANLVNGVSQQPDAMALPTQGRLQENAYSTVVEGLTKRPPTLHVATLPGVPDTSFFHAIDRGDGVEEYQVAIEPTGTIRVFDLEGTPRTVNTPNGVGYLTAGGDLGTLKAFTVADYTFVLNSAVIGAMDPATTPALPKEALVTVKAGSYGRTYKVLINGAMVAQWTAPDGSAASHSTRADAGYIAKALAEGGTGPLAGEVFTQNLAAAGITPANGWAVTLHGYVIHIRNTAGQDFTISVEDGNSGQNMVAVKDEAQNFSDLPPIGPVGFKVMIAGSPESRTDNYWVEFKGNEVWKETVAPGIPYRFNASTLPHVLVREADGTFTFRPANWAERMVGDEDTNPAPSVIGKRITDLGFGRSRLTFLTPDGAVMAESGEPSNLWRTTVTALIDSDPIDVASTQSAAALNHMVTFADDILIWSANTQYRLGGGTDLLTPKTASINSTSTYRMSASVRPAVSGTSVFFTVEGSQWASFWEYAIPPDADMGQAVEVSDHVPRYIPKGVKQLVAAPEHDVLFVRTAGDPAALYIYKFHWAGQDRLQSAWSRWTFGEGTKVLAISALRDRLYGLISRPGSGVCMEEIPIDPGFRDQDDTTIHLDRRVTHVYGGAFDPETDSTTFSLPYVVPTTLLVSDAVGRLIPILGRSGTTVTVAGDRTSSTLFFGVPYRTRYRPSTPRLRPRTQGGGTGPAIMSGRLQLRYMTFNYARTGTFDVIVSPVGRPSSTYHFSGRVLGDPQNVLGGPSLDDGAFRVPILCRNEDVTIEIVSDSHMPLRILSAEWEGVYTSRATRT